MLYGHDEGKNIKQLCNGEKDVVCIKMGGTGAEKAADAVNNLMACGLTGGTAIPSGSDLNDYKTVGNYYTSGGSVSASLSNTPTTVGAFMLKVLNGYGNTAASPNIVQIAISGYSPVMWCRALTNGSWTEWKQILTSGLVNDYIIEQGTNGIWAYEKYNSGIIKCWTTKYWTTPTLTMNAVGNSYKSNAVDMPFPSSLFVNVDTYFNVQFSFMSSGTYLQSVMYQAPSNNALPVVILKGGSSTAACSFSATAIGRWK